MTRLIVFLQSYIATREPQEDKGATMVEYALVVAGIALIALVGVKAFGGQLNTFFTGLGGKLGL